jgi:dihydrofolate reductase
MRTVTYGGAVSLDGYLTGPKGEVDWLIFSKDVQEVMKDSWKGVDTILMGRKTWEVAAGMSAGTKAAARKSKALKKKLEPKMRTYVFSRTLSAIDAPGVELVRSDAAQFVRALKQRPGGRIILMGGGELATSLLAADLVDEVGLNIHPILLGGGAPTFRDPGGRVKLSLTQCRQMEGGCILATYKVISRTSS